METIGGRLADNASQPTPDTSLVATDFPPPPQSPPPLAMEDILHVDYFTDGGVPIFRPTMDQFRDFKQFVTRIEPYGQMAGIVKIIPPQEWVDSLPDITENLQKVRIKNPITQNIMGGGLPSGSYRQLNMETRRTFSGMYQIKIG
jgi:hypothetical protein